MRLPEPAAEAWNRHREAIQRVADGAGRKGRLLLGGGTVLAARWKHRRSTDIDVLVPDRNAINDSHPGQRNDLAGATGGRVEGKWRDRIKVKVGATMLDVCAMEPQLPGLEGREEIDGRSETVLATAQILRGKLNRTQQVLARDAFDLVTASKADPKALQHAVNALDETETLVVAVNLKQGNGRIARDAPEVLLDVRGTDGGTFEELGNRAASAVTQSRYSRVTITLEESTVAIERITRNGEQYRDECHSEELGTALRETGIGEYLNVNHGSHETIVAVGIAELHREGVRGRVFNSTEPSASTRITDAADRAMQREAETIGPKQKEIREGGDPALGPSESRRMMTGMGTAQTRGPEKPNNRTVKR